MQWHGEYKVPGGKLVVCDFDVANGQITEFRLSGDFFLEPDTLLDDINRAFVGAPVDSSIADFAQLVRSAVPDEVGMIGVTAQAIGTSVRRALTKAATWRDYDWEIIHGPLLSPYENAALDELLTTQVGTGKRKPTLRIWESNAPAVFIGSFQSLRNEVDLLQARNQKISIVRRISGGGAMYMVPENCITYALYVPEELVRGMSFEDSYAFLDEWVIEALQQLGINARYLPLNDIAGPDGKIGGAAQKRLGSGGVLHHVTMAYDMNAQAMTKVLRIGREKLSDKGIKSADKRVDPLRNQTGLEREAIIAHMVEVFQRRHGGQVVELTEADLADARELVVNKFDTPAWRGRVA